MAVEVTAAENEEVQCRIEGKYAGVQMGCLNTGERSASLLLARDTGCKARQKGDLYDSPSAIALEPQTPNNLRQPQIMGLSRSDDEGDA